MAEFASPSIVESQSVPKFDDIFQALRFNKEVAENAFARTSKTLFKAVTTSFWPDNLEPFNRILTEELTWDEKASVNIATMSVIVDIDKDPEAVTKIVEALHALCRAVINPNDPRKIVLVDALDTSIAEVKDGFFRFSWKQRYQKGS